MPAAVVAQDVAYRRRRQPTFGPRIRDLRPGAAFQTPRRNEDICQAKQEAGPDKLPGQYPGVTPERLRSRTAQTLNNGDLGPDLDTSANRDPLAGHFFDQARARAAAAQARALACLLTPASRQPAPGQDERAQATGAGGPQHDLPLPSRRSPWSRRQQVRGLGLTADRAPDQDQLALITIFLRPESESHCGAAPVMACSVSTTRNIDCAR